VTSSIRVKGARTHNLKNIDVSIPHDCLVVVTGPSGSGKSSLAFDTLFAEGQRRYVESLSAYARQFLDRLPKPDADSIDGLRPAICIEQRKGSRNPRSTVATVTEIHDYLRLLYAHAGTAHCPSCDAPLLAQTVRQMVDKVANLGEGTRFSVLAPVIEHGKGTLLAELDQLRKDGLARVRLDGTVRSLSDDIVVDKRKEHTLEAVVDRLSVRPDVRQRLTDSLELGLRIGKGFVRIVPESSPELVFSERFACAACGTILPELTPKLFSFNSPHGACPACAGLGTTAEFAADLVLPDPSVSLRAGAVAAWGKPTGVYYNTAIDSLLKAHPKVKVDVPFSSLDKKVRTPITDWILDGLERRAKNYERQRRELGMDEERTLEYLEEELGRFQRRSVCAACHGKRLRPEALAVRIGDQSIADLCALPIRTVRDKLRIAHDNATPVRTSLGREIDARLAFLIDVGVDYLSLDRGTATLSGGEAQRIRLAKQIGSGLTGVLYVLDEPTVGLHPSDTARLLKTLAALVELGNTVLVVEHDLDVIRAAEHVIDMGPGAGTQGGQIVAEGSPADIGASTESSTGAFLTGQRALSQSAKRRSVHGPAIVVTGARANNLTNLTLRFPKNALTCVTGVSGSGKSSLVMDTLLPAARSFLSRTKAPVPCDRIEGLDDIQRVVHVDADPIGRTPRSNPASFVGALDPLRALFAELPEARARGYGPGRFSFNTKGGRCEACKGAGLLRVEMHFLPDVFVTCDECGGKRFNPATLEIKYRGLSISEVLSLSVHEAGAFFAPIDSVSSRIRMLGTLGLGYLSLGQNALTLSGGEAQRIKLARELSRRTSVPTLYILDEPTAGLHPTDVEVLLQALHKLVDAGNTIVVIEHHLGVISNGDFVIDLGPGGGPDGGRLIAEGPPDEIARNKQSRTGEALAAEVLR